MPVRPAHAHLMIRQITERDVLTAAEAFRAYMVSPGSHLLSAQAHGLLGDLLQKSAAAGDAKRLGDEEAQAW